MISALEVPHHRVCPLRVVDASGRVLCLYRLDEVGVCKAEECPYLQSLRSERVNVKQPT
jgi:predicted phosphatase